MIIETPSADDFKQASLNLLSLAWQMALESLESYEQSEIIHLQDAPVQTWETDDGQVHTYGGPDTRYTPEQRAAAEELFWRRSQPMLGNALSLIQQAIEMGLKGRIAAVSPFLLIARDARDYPGGSTTRDVPFSEFRSLDAADLLRVHNTVCAKRLDDKFATFWEEVRRTRNMVIHTVALNAQLIHPVQLLEAVLVTNRALHPGESWFKRYRTYFENDEIQAAFAIDPAESYANLVSSLDYALHLLPPSVAKEFFGYDHRARAYYCPHCLRNGDNHLMIEWDLGQTAFLQPKTKQATTLRCAICERTSTVVRQACLADDCNSTVIAADADLGRMCLFCRDDQDEWKEKREEEAQASTP